MENDSGTICKECGLEKVLYISKFITVWICLDCEDND